MTQKSKKRINKQRKRELEGQRNIRSKSAIVTGVIFLGLLILFMIFGLRRPLPLPEEKGIAVTLGNYQMGGEKSFENAEQKPPVEKNDEQLKTKQSPEEKNEVKRAKTSEPQKKEPAPDESISQNKEDAPQLNKKEATEKKKPEDEVEKKAKNQKDQADQTKQPKRKPDEKYMFPQKDQSPGDENKTGKKGAPGGRKDVKSDKKKGDAKENARGIDFQLSGRDIVKYPNIKDRSQIYGKVVVEIVVNHKGKVVRARPGIRGTTTYDKKLLQLARKAALETKFNKIPSSVDEQVGTITFNFKLH